MEGFWSVVFGADRVSLFAVLVLMGCIVLVFALLVDDREADVSDMLRGWGDAQFNWAVVTAVCVFFHSLCFFILLSHLIFSM